MTSASGFGRSLIAISTPHMTSSAGMRLGAIAKLSPLLRTSVVAWSNSTLDRLITVFFAVELGFFFEASFSNFFFSFSSFDWNFFVAAVKESLSTVSQSSK